MLKNRLNVKDGVDGVIGGMQIGRELPAPPNPRGSHSEASGSVDVGARVVPDEHDLLELAQPGRVEGVA